MTTAPSRLDPWPPLPHQEWADTVETLPLMTQVVGKIRMGHTPWINHSWSVPLYVSTAGLRTSLIPYAAEGVELSFDFLDHQLTIRPGRDAARLLRDHPWGGGRPGGMGPGGARVP